MAVTLVFEKGLPSLTTVAKSVEGNIDDKDRYSMLGKYGFAEKESSRSWLRSFSRAKVAAVWKNKIEWRAVLYHVVPSYHTKSNKDMIFILMRFLRQQEFVRISLEPVCSFLETPRSSRKGFVNHIVVPVPRVIAPFTKVGVDVENQKESSDNEKILPEPHDYVYVQLSHSGDKIQISRSIEQSIFWRHM
eukprot:scaffold40230_cov305-Amphora_coffeaeformis.AAC.1